MREPWLRALDECVVKRVKLPDDFAGRCEWDGVLRIANRASMPALEKLTTLLHECLHWVHQDKDETEILKLEKYYWARISPTALLRLLLELYPHLSKPVETDRPEC